MRGWRERRSGRVPGAGCDGGDPRPDSESVIAMVKSTERDLGLPHKLCEGAAQQRAGVPCTVIKLCFNRPQPSHQAVYCPDYWQILQDTALFPPLFIQLLVLRWSRAFQHYPVLAVMISRCLRCKPAGNNNTWTQLNKVALQSGERWCLCYRWWPADWAN